MPTETSVLVPTLEAGVPIATFTDVNGDFHQAIVITDPGSAVIAAAVKAPSVSPQTAVDAAAVVALRPDSVSTTNDGGTPVSGASIPAGGVGLTGWVSACWSELVSILAKLDGSIAVTGTFFQSTQPVSIASAITINGGNKPVGPANISPLQSTVGETAVLVIGQRTGAVGVGRCSVTLKNTGSTAVFIGGPGVTVGTGWQLSPGDIDSFDTTSAIYGISSTAGNVVCVMETF